MGKTSAKLTAILATSVVLVAAAYVVGSFFSYQSILENQVLNEARSLRMAMQAAWDYIDESQMLINYNSDGSYDFKGVYCSVAGKNIAQKFVRESDNYEVRYVRTNPRSGTDEPDAFEEEALNRFASSDVTEAYDFASRDGSNIFRYVYALGVKQNCLDCHGSPAGEKDVVGYLKEGFSKGDVAGAVSITIPLDSFEADKQMRLVQTIVFFSALMILLILLIRKSVRLWVARPLEEQAQRSKIESEERSNFLTIVSHEMRTPLSSIIAFADMCEKDLENGSAQVDELAIHEMRENSRVLLSMVNNTIDLARLEAGRYEVCPTEGDLADVVSVVQAATRPLARKKGVELQVEIPADLPIMVCDWESVRKILVNLLGNAVKFTDAGGRIALVVGYDAALSTCMLTVSDTGRGIDAQDLERIFERFAQSSMPTDAQTGSGLGLSLVKNLVEALGGTITVGSALGVGSVFTVTVPVKENA